MKEGEGDKHKPEVTENGRGRESMEEEGEG